MDKSRCLREQREQGETEAYAQRDDTGSREDVAAVSSRGEWVGWIRRPSLGGVRGRNLTSGDFSCEEIIKTLLDVDICRGLMNCE